MILIQRTVLCVSVLGCSEYNLKAPAVQAEDPQSVVDTAIEQVPSTPLDTAGEPETGTLPDTASLDEPVAEEECNGLDDDGDGEIDEGFDENGNGIADCLEEEAYCTPFDDFSDWSYVGSGDWHIESGVLTEGRGGLYDAIAWLYDLGSSDRFSIEVEIGWTGSLNDLAGIAWAIDGSQSIVVRWDDPQGDYGRHHPTGSIDLSFCEDGVCSPLVTDETVDLYRPADKSFSTLMVAVDGEQITVTLDGVVVLSSTEPSIAGRGPGVVGLYSNDNDGGVWFDDFCVWVEAF